MRWLRRGHKRIVDAVGYDISICLVPYRTLENAANHLGGIMDAITVLINKFVKRLIGRIVGKRKIHQPEVSRHVFRLAMETRRNGLVHFLCNFNRRNREGQRNKKMYDVGIPDRVGKKLFVRFCENNIVETERPVEHKRQIE